MKFYSFILVLLIGHAAMGQSDSSRVTNGFRFKDGLYLSFQDFQSNQPAFTWDQLDVKLVTSARTLSAQVEYVNQAGGTPIPLSAIWGFSLKGIPYLQTPQVEGKNYATFTGLKVRGKLCFFVMEQEAVEQVEIKAYNPLTKRPFRKGQVERSVTLERPKILHFETGAVADFTYANFLQWIADDRNLVESVLALRDDELSEKLYKCLLIYDDRNAVYVPVDQVEEKIGN